VLSTIQKMRSDGMNNIIAKTSPSLANFRKLTRARDGFVKSKEKVERDVLTKFVGGLH